MLSILFGLCLLALGDNKVYFLDGAQWKLCIEGNLVMCKNTLIYGEFVDEVSGKKNCPTVKKAFHIIDAMFLGGVDIRNLHYTCRYFNTPLSGKLKDYGKYR